MFQQQTRAAPPAATEALSLGRAVEQALEKLDADSGVALLCDGQDAFALRAATARSATRTLDLQYYIWHGDVTGRLLAREVLQAADRGVQVRLLLDDVYALGRERILAALDSHRRIEVRLFNGTRWRLFGKLGFLLELAFGGWHLNRRMHNKSWIADGRLAVCGGRNLGDAYFDADDALNFRDLDLMLAGRATAGAVTVFERYWNSPLARGAAHLSAAREAKGGLATLRQELELTASLPAAWTYLGPLRDWPLSDCLRRTLLAADASAVRVVADPPSKAKRGLGARRAARVAGGIAPEIAEALRAATREALIISPYFVPGDAGLALLCDLAKRGVHVSVVTNALAATDVVAVHGGYARYRRRLLAAGIELHELRPSGVEGASLFGSRGGASLHTKALAVDGDTAFVGSFNLDHRSAALNTEMGVLLCHPALACQLREEHARLADPARSWRVALDGSGRVVWHGLPAEGPGPLRREPGASLSRRIVAGVVRWLPIESQL